MFLSVHSRLLTAVSSNHGFAFRRILDALELPIDRIVLQLPNVAPGQHWLLAYVADNYKRNGFRLALRLGTPAHARGLMERTRLAAIKVDSGAIGDDLALARLLELSHGHGAGVIVTGVDAAPALAQLDRVGSALGLPMRAQGHAVCVAHETLQVATGAQSHPIAGHPAPIAV